MRLDVAQRDRLVRCDSREPCELAEHQRVKLFGAQLDLAASELLAIIEARMSSNRDAARARKLDSFTHRLVVSSVTAASDVRRADRLEEPGVLGRALADIRVQIDGQTCHG
jgi:hypothetical protein